MGMRVDELVAKVKMSVYKDNTYTEAFQSSPLIHIRDKVYVEVKVKEPEDFFHLRVNEYWATQSPKPNKTEGSVHTSTGCVNYETVTFLKVTSGTNDSTIRYSFDMFHIVEEPQDLYLYLHCTVHLCSPDDNEPCIHECKSITKRAVVRGDPTRGLLSYGLIRIDMPERPQSNLLMTTMAPVTGIWALGLFLLVLITMAKAGNRLLSWLANR